MGTTRAACLLLMALQVCPGADVAAFLAGRVQYWQERLGLRDWHVTVACARRDQMKHGTLGGIKWDKPKRTAHIVVLDPAEYTSGEAEMLKDLEFTVVHELVHLELASLPRSEASRRTEEQAVNNLARALLASAVREAPPSPPASLPPASR